MTDWSRVRELAALGLYAADIAKALDIPAKHLIRDAGRRGITIDKDRPRQRRAPVLSAAPARPDRPDLSQRRLAALTRPTKANGPVFPAIRSLMEMNP